MRSIAENNNLPPQNHYFQAKTVLKFKALLPVLQNFYKCWHLGGACLEFYFFIFLGTFFYWIRVGVKSSHLHFSSLKKTEESNQYIFQFSLGSSD